MKKRRGNETNGYVAVWTQQAASGTDQIMQQDRAGWQVLYTLLVMFMMTTLC